jgi:hypothetical protein
LVISPYLDLKACEPLRRTARDLALGFHLFFSGFDFREIFLQGQSALLCALGHLGGSVEKLAIDSQDGISAPLGTTELAPSVGRPNRTAH